MVKPFGNISDRPAGIDRPVGVGEHRHVIFIQREAELRQAVLASIAARRLAHLLDRGNTEHRKDDEDREYHDEPATRESMFLVRFVQCDSPLQVILWKGVRHLDDRLAPIRRDPRHVQYESYRGSVLERELQKLESDQARVGLRPPRPITAAYLLSQAAQFRLVQLGQLFDNPRLLFRQIHALSGIVREMR